MGKPAARLADMCTRLVGHSCFPPRPNASASLNVFINKRGAHRVGDSWESHCCKQKPKPCHGGTQASGSGTVFINGKPAARVGDQVSCGSRVMTGSINVFIGD